MENQNNFRLLSDLTACISLNDYETKAQLRFIYPIVFLLQNYPRILIQLLV